jgi:hypothetical protein
VTLRKGWHVVIDLRSGGDWSLDLCFAGLNKNGVDIIDVPYRDKHREWWDVIDGKKVPDWGLERRTLGHGCQDDRKQFIPNSTELVTLDILKKRNEVAYVWLDERMESFQKYRELGLHETEAKVVVVAGHDRFWNQSPSFVASLYGEKLAGMLLDNWYNEYANLPFKTKRIGWSANFDHYWERPVPALQKDIDISFIGYNSHPDRQRFIEHIQKKWADLNLFLTLEKSPDTFTSFLPKSKMFDIMMRSKICLNLRGAADRGKTLRAYEIPFVGSFMLSQMIEDPGIVDDFAPDEECSYFSNEKELDECIEFALGMPSWREAIASAGRRRASGALSVRGRWADVLEWLADE